MLVLRRSSISQAPRLRLFGLALLLPFAFAMAGDCASSSVPPAPLTTVPGTVGHGVFEFNGDDESASLDNPQSLGVNVLGTGVMLASFLHTGGLTGAEIGVAAATAFLNQKLLGALFGEAAMTELVADARRRLQELLQATFAEERARFDLLLPPDGALARVADDLRTVAAELRALQTSE